MKVCIVIPDGVGIRNYLYSNIITELIRRNNELIILHSLTDGAIKEVEELHSLSLNKEKLPVYHETKKQRFLRELISYSRLRYNAKKVANKTILTNWNPSRKGINKFVYFAIEVISKLFVNNYSKILKLEVQYQKTLSESISKHQQLLNKIKPDVIFSTHQRSIQAIPIIKAARELNIKTIGAIFSWDNLPKARLSVRTDSYIVWSDHMKNEMKVFYPEIDQENVEITGTPQFEFYNRKEFLLSKEEFCKQYDLDIHKKIVCFSGDDELTSPNDHYYLEDIASEVSKMDGEYESQILFRRCPVDLSDRYDVVLNKYSKLIKQVNPIWNNDSDKENWSIIYPSFEDVKLLLNTVYHSDIVINIGSTMAHDFTMYSKPSVYINYDINNNSNSNWSTKTIYAFQHFRTMGELKAVYWLNSFDDIQKVIKNAYEHSMSENDNEKWLDIIANYRDKSSINIVNYLLK